MKMTVSIEDDNDAVIILVVVVIVFDDNIKTIHSVFITFYSLFFI